METITFYSYKGGVGRTLALANVALYLSRFGLNTCLMDFDLEAPGLHHKFVQFLETDNIGAGLVDYIYEFTNNNIIPESLDEFSIEVIPPSESKGWVRLIPAGNVLSPDYWRKLAAIDWRDLFYEDHSEGIPFFLELKEKISEKFKPDLLLIDSRTGITEMSGLCTALLADSVVFLIVNNQENIEGARQILRSIQNVERFPNQKPIDVTFVLTRIPFSETDADKEIEGQIVERIRDSLNEHVEKLENQLDVQDICVLHSDRELELSESLRLWQEESAKETPLRREYLNLFAGILPDDVILPRIDDILNEITVIGALETPDKAEQVLESFVESYKHPKTIKALIDFYVRYRSRVNKIVDAINDLWRIYGIDDSKIRLIYISLFMRQRLPLMNFELEIIEEHLRSDPVNGIKIEMKLAETYNIYGNPEMALEHYSQLVDKVEERKEIFEKILEICIKRKFHERAIELIEIYGDEAKILLFIMLQNALGSGDANGLVEIGELLYEWGRKNEFITALAESSVALPVQRSVLARLAGEPEGMGEIDADDDIPF